MWWSFRAPAYLATVVGRGGMPQLVPIGGRIENLPTRPDPLIFIISRVLWHAVIQYLSKGFSGIYVKATALTLALDTNARHHEGTPGSRGPQSY